MLVDAAVFKRRLAQEEKRLLGQLAELEGQLRAFEDEDRPAYERWLRMELGPGLSALEELYQQIRERRGLALRVEELRVTQRLHAREALYVALGLGRKAAARDPNGDPDHRADGNSDDELDGDSSASPHGHDPRESAHGKLGKRLDWSEEEIEARRRATREAKRAARKESKRESKRDAGSSGKASSADSGPAEPGSGRPEPARRRLVTLYRNLARRLHPDSPLAIASERAPGLWLEVQGAYDDGNYERLLAVSAWLSQRGMDPEARLPQNEASLSERHEQLRALGRSCTRLGKQIEKLAQDAAWKFALRVGTVRKKIRQRAARQLGEELSQAQGALAQIEDFLEEIGPPRPPRPSK